MSDLFLKFAEKLQTIKRMTYRETSLKGSYVIEPQVFRDSRGYFIESFKSQEFINNIGRVQFIQDNESKSSKGVLRGLHYQKGEYSQAKLVRVIRGRVLDVAVDIRRSSPTFMQHILVELNDENYCQLFIPRGFAHGFLVLSDEAIFSYKVDNVYAPQAEASIRWDDPQLNIAWPVSGLDVLTSEKDLKAPLFKDAWIFD